ncbi:ferredoxin [Pontiella sulfatireligans]|uniref:Ferredoxin n=1 Tax=Pontiella sulfatireligans TaxID=2750658 RepID=A0A6C2UKX0_9BACT|nr:ferredoxin [Pontiella sulfatireligans]VGO19944.1 Ferredoxin [Pontiella sulfatireligans]
MKATVDPDLCIGCGVCEQICDAVFEMDDNVAKVKGAEVPPEAEASCQEAADACPVEAITIAK